MLEAAVFLGFLDESDIEWLVANSQQKHLPPGSILIHHGNPVEFLYLIVHGKFDVTVDAPEPRYIASLFSGELVGEMSFVDQHPPSATVTAGMNSEVLAIEKRALNEKIRSDSDFGSRFFKGISALLAGRLRAASSIDVGRRRDAEGGLEMSQLERRYREIQQRLGLKRLAQGH